MELKQYQQRAVDELILQTKRLLSRNGDNQVCVLKAPTGSGKTIMVADFLNQLGQEQLPDHYAFLWISGMDLHTQSHDKLAQYLSDSRYTLSFLDDVQENELGENEIVFINWHSITKRDRATGEYTNVYMRDQENGRTLQNFITETKANGKQLILIVDESHYHYWSDETQHFVQSVINPKLVIEVSATPRFEPSAEEVVNGDKGLVAVRFEDVVNEGMIKANVVINDSLGKFTKLYGANDEMIIDAAIAKQKQLVKEYMANDSTVKPLILVQLPSNQNTMSALDETKLEFLSNYLKSAYDITVENGKLAIWLSNNKQNTDDILENDSDVEILIFKQAIALGWDCPRAQILVMFRDIKSITFEIQTVGRILRMPEIKHYANSDLNRAYVFTNLDKVQIKDDKTERAYFQTKQTTRSELFTPVNLPSVYQKRLDYGDLTAVFHRCFYRAANERFGIKENDMAETVIAKVDESLELEPDELTRPIMVDAIIENLDKSIAKDIIGESEIQLSASEGDIKLLFQVFAKARSLPFAPVRSHTKIQQAIYNWFDSYLGYKGRSRLDIQRIIVCSERNNKIFRQIIEDAKDRFRVADQRQKQLERLRKDIPDWNPPEYDFVGESSLEINSDNSLMQPCYLPAKPSLPEQEFIELVTESKNVDWWYRNGTSKETYLGIPYFSNESKREDTFYPDFIIKFTDGSLGIYDTKQGMTIRSEDTAEKSDSLQAYLRKHSTKDQKLVGGIIDVRPSGMFLFTDEKYSWEADHKGWKRLVV